MILALSAFVGITALLSLYVIIRKKVTWYRLNLIALTSSISFICLLAFAYFGVFMPNYSAFIRTHPLSVQLVVVVSFMLPFAVAAVAVGWLVIDIVVTKRAEARIETAEIRDRKIIEQLLQNHHHEAELNKALDKAVHSRLYHVKLAKHHGKVQEDIEEELEVTRKEGDDLRVAQIANDKVRFNDITRSLDIMGSDQ